MGILQRLRSSFSARDRLLSDLTEITGRKQLLVDRMKRHAALCIYPALKAGLEGLAHDEAAHVKALNAILADHDLWSRPPEATGHDGSNNWERLGADLQLMAELSREINTMAIRWEPIDQEMSARFAAMYAEDVERTSLLRDLALKCDPQAFD
jgi:hypothetical protein